MRQTSLERFQDVCLFAGVLAVTSLCTFHTWKLYGSPRIGIDDANIFFVYARHLADGLGFVYNAGGERVEGFTSLAWVLVCAFFFELTPTPEILILILCVVMTAIKITLAVLCLGRLFGTAPRGPGLVPVAVAYLALLFSSPAYVIWTTITLMDGCLWSLLILAMAVVLLDGEGVRASVVLSGLVVLSVLTRPEAFALCPVVLAVHGAREYLQGGRVRNLVRPVAAYVIAVIGLTSFRLVYFGFPLPNTYYAKVSDSLSYNLKQGWDYFSSFVDSTPVAAVAVVLVFLVLAADLVLLVMRGPPEELDASTACAVLCAALLVIPIWSGGDYFPLSRFYQSAYPLLVLFMLALARRIAPTRGVIVLAGSAALATAGFLGAEVTWRSLAAEQPLRVEFEHAENGRRVARAFMSAFDSPPSIGVITAGGFKSAYAGEVVDLMGLNNVRMGHSPGDRAGIRSHAAFDKRVFFELRPTILLPGVGGRDEELSPEPILGFTSMVLRRLDRDPEFHENYEYAALSPRGSVSGLKLTGFFLRTYLAGLSEEAYVVEVSEPSSSP